MWRRGGGGGCLRGSGEPIRRSRDSGGLGGGWERGESEMLWTGWLESEREVWSRRRLQRALRFQVDGADVSGHGKMMWIPGPQTTRANTYDRVFYVPGAVPNALHGNYTQPSVSTRSASMDSANRNSV